MVEFIGFCLFVALLVSFPYSRVWHRLNQLLDAKLFLTGLLLIAFRFICAAVLPETGDAPSPPPAYGENFADRFSLMTVAFAGVLSWIMVITGVAMVIYAFWQAKEHRQELRDKKQGNYGVKDES